MKLNREELKFILDDLFLNRDKAIREYNESLYVNSKNVVPDAFKNWHWCQTLHEAYSWYNWYRV